MPKVNEDFGAIGRVVFKSNYDKALKTLKNLMQRKKDKKHDIYYYAARVAQSFKGVEPRRLVAMMNEAVSPDILPKSGGGQIGTDTLVQSYIRDTPGQKIKKFKDYIK